MNTLMQAPGNLFACFVLFLSLNAPAQLQFTDIHATDEGAIQLHWQSESNTVYRVEFANELSDPPQWEILTDFYPSHGTNTFILDAGDFSRTPYVQHPKNSNSRFYQIFNVGTNSGPPPQLTITGVTNGDTVSGTFVVTVAGNTEQAGMVSSLYVDGQLMQPPFESTNYAASGTNFLMEEYLINSCEWPNGPHTFFATAESHSEYATTSSQITVGRTVSSYVNLTFSNLISRFAWSEPFFNPDAGQTQLVSAVFAANVDWTLQVLDRSSNAVRTVTGSGSTMQFAFDGTGEGGTNLPAGVYRYWLSAQTNGMASSMMSESSSVMNASVSSEEMEWWALSPNESATPVPLELFPPGFDTNGFTILEASESEMQALSQSSSAWENSSTEESGPQAYDGPATQVTTGPERPPTMQMIGVWAPYGIAYGTYAPGPFGPPVMQPPLSGQPFPFGHRVVLGGVTGPVTLNAMPWNATEKIRFEYVMRHDAAWSCGFDKHDNALYGSDLRGISAPINSNHIALLILHGFYGTSADWYANQCQQIYFPLWSFGMQRDGSVTSREEWLRMSEFSFGSSDPSGLKWIALKACWSLRQENVDSMDQHSVYPFNSDLHVLLGFDSLTYEDPNFAKLWAGFMVNSNMTVSSAWVAAGEASFRTIPAIIPINCAAWGHQDNFNDKIMDPILPSVSGDLHYESTQVHP